MTGEIVVFCTCSTETEALTLAEALIASRSAACVNVLPPVRSIYRWQGKIERAEEWLLLIKSTAECFDALRDQIQHLHSYDVPEIIAIPIVAGSQPYLAWLREQLSKAE